MTAAVIGLAVVTAFALAASIAAFVVEQPAAGWVLLVVSCLVVLSLLGMVASTAQADRRGSRGD